MAADYRAPRMESLRLSAGDTEIEIVPSRGAIVSRFRTLDREVLYLDESTLADPSKNVRGGVPILFPAPGKLKDGRFLHRGRAYEMKQHGFARDLPWDVVEATKKRVVLALESSAATRALFPFEFRLEAEYQVDCTTDLPGGDFYIRLTCENRSDEPLPFHAGLHPYVFLPDAAKAQTTIKSGATRAFDNVTKKEIPFRGFDLTLPEVDLHLADHGSRAMSLPFPDGGFVQVHGSPEMTHWVVWTLAGKDFVCLEPWTAPAGALNTGKGLLPIATGERKRIQMTLTACGPIRAQRSPSTR
jgi:galactose mutarotase-like enzyme